MVVYRCNACGAEIDEPDRIEWVENHMEVDTRRTEYRYKNTCPYCGSSNLSEGNGCGICGSYTTRDYCPYCVAVAGEYVRGCMERFKIPLSDALDIMFEYEETQK